MTTFTIPFAFYGTATIEADHEGEARLTVAKDLQLGIDETTTDAPITDNGAVLTFHSFEVAAVEGKHTQGPWMTTRHYDPPHTYCPFITVGPAQIHFYQGYDIATDPERKARAEADARLIAETLNMRTALEELIPLAIEAIETRDNASDPEDHECLPEYDASVRNAQAILARIEGIKTPEPSAPVIAVGDAVALLRQAVAAWGEMLETGGEINGGDSVQWLADFVADAANVLAGKAPDARPSVIDADLAEAAGDDLCLACERPSLDCSRAPCAAVLVDRGEATCGDHAHDILADEFAKWCAEQGLVEQIDAEEMIHRDYLTSEQRTWLSTFIIRWNADGVRPSTSLQTEEA